jgi:hypothetical protein
MYRIRIHALARSHITACIQDSFITMDIFTLPFSLNLTMPLDAHYIELAIAFPNTPMHTDICMNTHNVSLATFHALRLDANTRQGLKATTGYQGQI